MVSLRALNKFAKARVLSQTRSSNCWRGLFMSGARFNDKGINP